MRGAAREKDKSLPSARLVSDCLVRRDGSTTSGIRTQLDLARAHIQSRAKFLGLPDSYTDKAIEQAEKTAQHIVDLCESPIERLILPWLLVEDYGPLIHTFPAKGFNHQKDVGAPVGDIVIAPQFAFIRYRADFAILVKANGKSGIFVLECDGNPYHGAATDNPRDACFASCGVRVIRACGSEINSRPRNVSALVSSIIQEWVSK